MQEGLLHFACKPLQEEEVYEDGSGDVESGEDEELENVKWTPVAFVDAVAPRHQEMED